MKFYLKAVVVASFLLASAAARAIPIVSVDVDPSTIGIQSSRNVAVGDSFNVDIFISGVEASQSLFSFSFDLLYNSTMVNATGVAEGPFLPSGGATSFFSDLSVPGDAFALDTLLSTTAGVTGDGLLATISFDAIGSGLSPLSLSGVQLVTLIDTGTEINATFIPFESADGSVGVRSVPVPPTLLLVGVGLAALFKTRRR